MIRTLYFIWTLLFAMNAFAMENAFYILRSNSGLNTFATHYNQIQYLIPQAYVIDQKGQVGGLINPETFDFAKKHNMKILALVTNAGFDKVRAHQFLTNPKAVAQALQTILLVCIKNQIAGVQMDFEGVSATDSAALTDFYKKIADAFHKEKMVVSFAIVGRADGPLDSAFSKKQFANWSGVYDLKALAPLADFITLMSYDQHSQGTTPGPTANIHWVESTIQFALHNIPHEKLSLGIPVFSGYWRTAGTGNSVKVVLSAKTFSEIQNILKKHNVQLAWDKANQIHYAFYTHDWLNEYVFAEDAASFKAKYDLAKKYNLRGISVFSIGSEDPNIWKLIPTNQAVSLKKIIKGIKT